MLEVLIFVYWIKNREVFMKFLFLALFVGCAPLPQRPPEVPSQSRRMEECMLRFSREGFSAEAVVKICEAANKRRE